MVPRRVTRNGRTRLDLIDGRPVLEPHDRDVALEHRCLDCGAIDRATYEWLFDRIGDPPASVARWYPELMEEAAELAREREQVHAHM